MVSVVVSLPYMFPLALFLTLISFFPLAFGEMAAISGGFLLLTVPLYLFGARIRTASFKWRIMNLIGWNADRDDVGEFKKAQSG